MVGRAAQKTMALRIEGPVGRGGTNRRADVRTIQRLLNAVFPATPLEIDGLPGRKTVRRIERFQRFMRRPDGRVDPRGRTLRRLNEQAPGLQPEWSGDPSRWSQERKLASLYPRMRRKVERILAALDGQGFRPKLFFAWRSIAAQHALVEAGHSRVRFSFHNAQKSGAPAALAADIIDRRWGWSQAAARSGFWDALGRAARRENLYWGGSWPRFKDLAHVQLHPNTRLAQVRRESGFA